MLVGLVSDTHGVFDPALADSFAGVEHVLHGGDVGSHGGHAAVLSHFRRIAPTTAVSGNVDDDAAARAELPETALITLNGWLVLVVHILASAEAAAALKQHRPDVMVHGHSHQFSVEVVEGMGADGGRQLRVNPGSAGPARFRLGRSTALLTLPDRGSGEWPSVQQIPLAAKAPPRLPEASAAARRPKAAQGKRTQQPSGAGQEGWQEGGKRQRPGRQQQARAAAVRTRAGGGAVVCGSN